MATEAQKNRTVEIWLQMLPKLRFFSRSILLRMVGPTLIGLELTKLQMADMYQPHLVVFPLWKIGIKECTRFPILYKVFNYNGKSQIQLPYTATEQEVCDLSLSVTQSHLLTFDGAFKKDVLFSVIENYLSEPPQSSVPFSHLQADLWEAKFFFALYLDSGFALQVLDELKSKPWNLHYFKMAGIDKETWIDTLDLAFIERNRFLATIAKNIESNRTRFLFSELEL